MGLDMRSANFGKSAISILRTQLEWFFTKRFCLAICKRDTQQETTKAIDTKQGRLQVKNYIFNKTCFNYALKLQNRTVLNVGHYQGDPFKVPEGSC